MFLGLIKMFNNFNLSFRGGSKIIWIAPSGGRDRPDPITNQWFPVRYILLICYDMETVGDFRKFFC